MRVYNQGPVKQRSMPFWCVGNRLSDPFGSPVLEPITSLEVAAIICTAAKQGLIELTAAHDDDLVPWDPNKPEDDLDQTSDTHRTLVATRAMLEAADVGFHMMTCNLHANPIFRQGGLTNPDSKIREMAKLKVRRAIRIGAFLGARKFTYWVARDGWIVGIKTAFNQVYQWTAEALNDARNYIKEQGFTSYEGGTIEPKPNEPTGHSFLPTAGHAVGFIMTMLDEPAWWGVNPELTQHEGMTLLDAVTCVAYLTAVGKLSFLHFGSQIKGHEDNDYPPLVSPEGLKETAYMFWVLKQARWQGVVEFDCHMLRSEGSTVDQTACVLKFIGNCSLGLSIALLLAERLETCYDHCTNDVQELDDSEADLLATTVMCGLNDNMIARAIQGSKIAV